MNPAIAFAALLAMAAGTAAAASASPIAPITQLTDPISHATWSQNADGVTVRGTVPGHASATRTVKIRTYSAVTRAPLAGALAWWIASDAGTPLLE